MPINSPVNVTDAIEFGVRFQSERAGFIRGVRFYKMTGNSGLHIANLWTHTGTLLASAAFANEGASGWQQVDFGTSIPISANVTYVTSYHSDSGPYAIDYGYFNNGPVVTSPLKAIVGTFVYGTTAFPGGVYDNSNYWVDPVFADSPASGGQTVQGATLFAPTATPTSNYAGTFEVGVRFRSAQNGYIQSLRFYKLPQNTGIHVGSLWAANGTLLGRVTFSDETDSGWQEARLPTSVPIVAHKAYVVSYHTDNGFGYDSGYFTTSRFRAPLYATANGVDGSNGLYGSAGAMPTNGGGNNYWADVVFASNPLPTELEAQGPARSIWESSTYTPTLTAPMQQVEVGVRFQSARPGYIQGVRFFKGTNNSSEYLGNLWSEDGELLASGIFANETAIGWQEVTFARSVPISANTTYIASYHSNNGPIALTEDYFRSFPAANPPLRTVTSGGVYRAGPSGFPGQNYNNNNYWVDVAFANDVAPKLPFVETSSFWLDGQDQPAVASNANNVLVELGVKVRSNRDGLIEGLHYFNGDVNVTTHTAKLWTSDGDLLMSEVFTNTPEIGWLNVMFTTPVSITANTTYVMSYDTTGAFPSTSEGLVVPPRSISPAIRALAHDEDGDNGVYAYGSGFPNATYNATNYWVDVFFSADGSDPYEELETTVRSNPTASYYERTISTTVHKRQGCAARRNGETGIVVLAYGVPRSLAGTLPEGQQYGASIFTSVSSTALAGNLNQIHDAVLAFAEGYSTDTGCTDTAVPGGRPSNLTIAVGLSNAKINEGSTTERLNEGLTAQHGAAWARMVQRIDTSVNTNSYAGITVQGAIDAEPGWWMINTRLVDDGPITSSTDEYASTKGWIDGFRDAHTGRSYYCFCSQDGGMRDGTLIYTRDERYDRIQYVAMGNSAARALPQIYYWVYAQEWFNLKRYAQHHKLPRYDSFFWGEMTNCAESDTCKPNRAEDSWTTFDLLNDTFAPNQGWWSFYDALNRTISARYKLKNSLVLGDDFRVVQNTRVIPPSGPAFESGSFIDRLTYSQFPGGTKLNAFNIISSQQYLPSKIPVFRSTQQELAWSTDIGFSE